MKVSGLSAILLQLGAIAFAQDLTSLPKCAQAAAIQGATSSGCGTDASCLCNNAGFISSLKSTISGSCTGADQQAACTWAHSACAAYGATIDCGISAVSGASTAPVGTTTTMTSMASTAAAGTTSMESGSEAMSATSSSSMLMSLTTSMMSMTTSTMHSGNGTMQCTHGCGNHTLAPTSMMSKTASGPTSQYTGAANTAARHCGMIGLIAGIALLEVLL